MQSETNSRHDIMSDNRPENTLEFELVKTFAVQRQWYINMWREKGYDLIGVEWNVLNILWFNGPTPQADIITKIKREKTFVTRLVKKMSEKGWLYTEPDPEDRRSMIVYLTKEGSAMKKELVDLFFESRKENLRGISDKDQKALIKLLRHWRNNMI